MAETTTEKHTQRQVSDADRARAELSDYFRFEDVGAPAVSVEPRAGTSSPEQRPPLWPPQCDAVLMALVYRRLCLAQERFSAEGPTDPGWRDIFAVLRAKYGEITPREEQCMMVNAGQVRTRRYALRVDRAEELYLEARKALPAVNWGDRERRRLMAREAVVFGRTDFAGYSDTGEDMGDAALRGSPVYDSGLVGAGAEGNAKCGECGTTDPGGRRGKFYIGSDGLPRCWVCQDRRIAERGQLTGERLVAWVKERLT